MFEIRYEEVARLFTYDRETGVLYWRIRDRNTIRHKYVAGSTKGAKDGYRRVGIKGKNYQEHRIIMMLCFGHIPENAEIDHINHVRDDNRLCNIRIVDNTTNSRNASIGKNNTTGVCGVYVDKRKAKRYCAEIKVNRIKKFLGYFYTLDEAAAARREAELKYGFHSNHGTNKAAYVKKR